MNAKNKVVLVAAIGAVLVLVSSTAVRCTLAHISEEEAEHPASQQEQKAEPGASITINSSDSSSSEPEEAESEEENRPGAKEAALQTLRSHAWQMEGDAGRTISFKDGAFVEADADGVAVTAFEVENVTEGDGQGALEVRLSRDGVAEEISTIIAVEGHEGALKVSSDGFAKADTYVQGSASAAPVATSGVTEPYTTLIGGKTDSLASAIAEWCRDNAPTATEASFDGEVFLDVKGGRVVATFSCDDAAKTILSVEYTGGEFHVSG